MEDSSFDDDEMLAEMLGSSGGDLDLEGILAADDLPPLTEKVSEGVPPGEAADGVAPAVDGASEKAEVALEREMTR